MMSTSLEGRFWLALTLLLSLIIILAFFTENEQLLFKEAEFLAESSIKGIEFLTSRASPQLKAWLPKVKDLKLTLFPKENDIFDHKEDPSVIFKLILQEKDKIAGLLRRWDWEGVDIQVPPPLSTQSLPGVYEYAEAIKISCLTSSLSGQFKIFSEKAGQERIRNSEHHKQIIVAWFDKILARHEEAIRMDAVLINERLNYLQSALKQDQIKDQSLKKLVEKRISCLEDLLTSWSKKFEEAYINSTADLDKLLASIPEATEETSIKSQSGLFVDKFFHFNQFRAIFKEIELLEF